MTKRHADSDDETYVSVGRPFEFLETAEDVQKAKARKNKDQYVTDDQGRRRFHGAFTGGFSAGYYNTVGSKEALQIHFVNENHWVVSLSMNGVISLYNSGTISDGLAEQLARIYGHLEASIDGWTPSSFVSTRGKRSDYGGQRPEDFMDEEDFGAHGIAPKVVSAQEQFAQAEGERKRPHTDSGVIPGVPPLENLIVPSKSTIGAQILKAMGWREGQGVGPKVLRHQPHQERVYGPARPGNTEVTPSKLSERYMFAPQDSSPWEFTGKDDLHGLGYHGMEERGVLAPSKATKALYGMKGEAFGTGALEDADDDDENVYGMESMTSYDVSLAGEGDLNMERSFGWTGRESDTWDLSSFTKALKKPEHYKSHPPPCVPKTFVPVHKFKTSAAVNSSLGKPLSSNDRSQLLTDNTGSVFGLMAPSDRERLKNAADKAKAMSSSSQAVTELKREQPVAVAGVKSVTEWESKGKERMARAAAIFKPLATSLASRFTRSNENEETPKSPESDAIQAARADMFGALTREMLDWYPHRIVCKRFNVPDPYPGQSLVGLDDGSEKKHKDRVLHFELTEKLVTDEVDEQEPDNDTTEFLSKEEASEQEKEEDESKPPMDLFKAIFATSEDSSSSSDESEVSTTISTQQTLHTEQTSISTQSQSSLFLTGTQNSQKRWQDLSVVTKQVKPPKDSEVLSKSLSFENSQSSESTPSIEKLKLITETQSPNIPLKPVVASYGPSLPPDVQQPLSSRTDHYQKFTLKHSDDPQHVKSKKLHKKHKQEERQHREHKKKKHRHKKH